MTGGETMDRNGSPSLAQAIAASQGWWREAGVDFAYADEAATLLAEPEREPAIEEAPKQAAAPERLTPSPPLKAGGDPAKWPTTLPDFTDWWLSEPSLDFGGTRARIAPRGSEGARLMVLVAEPEAMDSDMLLSGPEGELLANFLKRAEVQPEETYFASMLPTHTPMADWSALHRAGLGEVALHHVALARPQRLLVFGQAILPLIGHDPANNPALLRKVNHRDGSVPALAARSLASMAKRPETRKVFWQRWLDWTDG